MLEAAAAFAYCCPTMTRIILIILILLGLSAPVLAEEPAPLPVPRYVSLGTDEVNVRTGPGARYPIKFVLKKDELPVEIIKEYDIWRQIRTQDGDEGWVHKSMLSGRRHVTVTGHMQTLYKKADASSRPVVKLEPGVIAGLDHCDNEWCYLKVASYKGWMKRENLWGIYPGEKIQK